MTNLLSETLLAISESGHKVEDILFIGSSDGRYSCTWQEFQALADVEYDSGFGGAEVATDLVVRFHDGNHLWRGEYDGSEWWDYDKPADVDYSRQGKPIRSLVGGLWASVAELDERISE